jgi:hypothetical protein
MDKFSKFDIGDFIYLILVLIGIISGVFGDKKKKKKQAEDEVMEPKPRSFFEMLEESMKQFTPQKAKKDVVVKEAESPKKIKVRPKSKKIESLLSSETTFDTIDTSASEVNFNPDQSEINTPFRLDLNSMEIRKAFIYKEIIDRKEY